MTGYIYKITNDINDKVYIGKTLKTIEDRWKIHLQDRSKEEVKNRPLYKAMNKYGKEHFHIEKIECCDESIIDNREIYWIEYYHSYSNGYNATLGGDGKTLYNYDLIIKLNKQGLTTKQICDIVGCCRDVVYDVLHKEGIDPHDNVYKQWYNPIKAIFKDGTEKVFESVTVAAKWLQDNNYTQAKAVNGIISNIGRVANGKQHRKSYLGIRWEYINK